MSANESKITPKSPQGRCLKIIFMDFYNFLVFKLSLSKEIVH